MTGTVGVTWEAVKVMFWESFAPALALRSDGGASFKSSRRRDKPVVL